MAPQPSKDVEVDMERKEELIIAKQLRACRVNILPKASLETFGFKPPSPPPPVSKKKQFQPPRPRMEDVKKASNPIALRYWNQCMNQGSTNARSPGENLGSSEVEFSAEDPPWVTSQPPADRQGFHPAGQPARQQKISVPDIRRHMKEVKSSTNWEEILREEESQQAQRSKQAPAFYKYRETTHTTHKQQQQQQRLTGNGQTSQHYSNSKSERKVSQQQVAEFPRKITRTDSTQPRAKGLDNPGTLSVPSMTEEPRDHDDPSPMMDRKSIQYERILSTAGQGIKRENEVAEAKMNINRFITMGMLKDAEDKMPTNIEKQAAARPEVSSQDQVTNFSLDEPPAIPVKKGIASEKHAATNAKQKTVSRDNFTTASSNKHVAAIDEIAAAVPSAERLEATDHLLTVESSYVKDDTSMSSNFSSSESDFEDANEDVKASDEPGASDFIDVTGDIVGADPITASDNNNSATLNKEDLVLGYLSEADVKDVGSSVVQKLEDRRKNALGMLFYREMSSDLVKEIVAQEILNLSGKDLITMLETLSPEVCERIIPGLLMKVKPERRSHLLQPFFSTEPLKDQLNSISKDERRRLFNEFRETDAADEKADEIPEILVTAVKENQHESIIPGKAAGQEEEFEELYNKLKVEDEVDGEEIWEEWEWEEGEEWEEEEEEYTVETFEESYSIAL